MFRSFLSGATWLLIVSIAAAGWSQRPPTLFRVLNPSGVEGIAGVVLLLNTGDNQHSLAIVTDAQGRASLPHLTCEICTITALDPSELYFNKTSEFDGRATCVTITLQVRPIIDNVGDPRAKKLKIKVYAPHGELLPNRQVIIRPVFMDFQANWAYRETTDSTGLVVAHLRPGKYIVATVTEGSSWEGLVAVVHDTKARTLIYAHLSAAVADPQ